MRKKLVAAIMSAAMVACASPLIALAEPVADVETEGTPVADEALIETVSVAEPEEDIQADAIIDQASLEAAIAKGGTVDLGDQTIQLDRTLAVTNDVVITGGKLVGTSVVTGNLVTLGTKSWYGVNVDWTALLW